MSVDLFTPSGSVHHTKITHIRGEVGQGYLGSPDPVSCRKCIALNRGASHQQSPQLWASGARQSTGVPCVWAAACRRSSHFIKILSQRMRGLGNSRHVALVGLGGPCHRTDFSVAGLGCQGASAQRKEVHPRPARDTNSAIEVWRGLIVRSEHCPEGGCHVSLSRRRQGDVGGSLTLIFAGLHRARVAGGGGLAGSLHSDKSTPKRLPGHVAGGRLPNKPWPLCREEGVGARGSWWWCGCAGRLSDTVYYPCLESPGHFSGCPGPSVVAHKETVQGEEDGQASADA